MLNELEDHIAEHGTISEYQNGANQSGTKSSPEVQVYNSMIKNHMTIIKQLTELSKGTNTDEGDEFDAFLLRR